MAIELSRLVESITPENTVLFFGSGSSVPSGAPSAHDLINSISQEFSIENNDYSLSEISGIAEGMSSRKDLVTLLRHKFSKVKPTGGVLNIPLYRWKSIYTTNYDNLIEKSFEKNGKSLRVYSSDFDFTIQPGVFDAALFKLHGSIEKDICDGSQSRIIITESDYDNTGNYRDGIFTRFSSDLLGSHLIIIGYSLKDKHIADMVKKVVDIGARTGGATKTTLLLFSKDEGRAALYESRGIDVCFGGVDEFFDHIAKNKPSESAGEARLDSIIDACPSLRPCTIDASHASAQDCSLTKMFNGYAATHADIVCGLTFERSIVDEVESYLLASNDLCATILGPSGVGKTTAGRQVMQRLRHKKYQCFEHKQNHSFDKDSWVKVAQNAEKDGINVLLMIDEAGSYLFEINSLIDEISSKNIGCIKLLFVSERNHWVGRIKSPVIFKRGKEFKVSHIKHEEVDRLLTLIDTNKEIKSLIEPTFGGFSRHERRRRLVEKCESEFFVCLKNIFATEKFDDIILREFAKLDESCQEIYRQVAAMESSGVRVHRQLVIRALGLEAQSIHAVLDSLMDIVTEYDINAREGVYGWKCRHNVIAGIIRKYKFFDESMLISLFEKVIENVSPTYDIEIRTIRELCNFDTGISSISDKNIQNRLLRKMMSIVPGERVPRHRLIRNLIEQGNFDKAETEIRIFESDFKRDGPVSKYKISLLLSRAKTSDGIMNEDRLTIINQAKAIAESSVIKFHNNIGLLAAYCDVGIEYFRLTNDYSVYDSAINQMKSAEEKVGDPSITKLISKYSARLNIGNSEITVDIPDD